MRVLSDDHTVLLLSYEERTTGNKPEIEKKFFEVGARFVHVFFFFFSIYS